MMQDAIGNDLEIGDYVACVLGDWVNNQHLGKVMGCGNQAHPDQIRLTCRAILLCYE